ncbi:neuroglobin-like protein, partial [Dinothrombium tinctorium]
MILKEDGSYDWDLSQLERHAVLVMQALEAAIENLDDSRVLSLILKELGCKHARYNVQEFMFQKLWKAIKYSLITSLGKEVMNKETIDAWFHVFQYIAIHIIQGMREYRKAAVS